MSGGGGGGAATVGRVNDPPFEAAQSRIVSFHPTGGGERQCGSDSEEIAAKFAGKDPQIRLYCG